jgi:hypothetical protein
MELLNTSCFEKFNKIYYILYPKNLYFHLTYSFKKVCLSLLLYKIIRVLEPVFRQVL